MNRTYRPRPGTWTIIGITWLAVITINSFYETYDYHEWVSLGAAVLVIGAVLVVVRASVKVDDSGITIRNRYKFETYRLKWTEIEKFIDTRDPFWTQIGIEPPDFLDQGAVVTSSGQVILMEGVRGSSGRPAKEIVAILNDRLKAAREA